jgi:nucleoside-triphosphatase THEP1
MITDEIKKHERFTKEVKDYIRECLKNEVTPPVILASFKKFIDEVIKEFLKEAKTK